MENIMILIIVSISYTLIFENKIEKYQDRWY